MNPWRWTRFEWGVVAGVLAAMLVTSAMIKIDEACAYHADQSFICDVAHGFLRVMAPARR